jgi:CRP/FNR family transcriptional regulator, cyclic AMP receptor protein
VRTAEQALAALPLLRAASPEDVQSLARQAFPRHLTRGQVLFVEGDPSDHLFVVERGRLKVTVGSARGQELLLQVVGPGGAVGELSVVDRLPRSAGATALDDLSLWCVPADALRTALARSPGLCLALAEDLAAQVRRLTGASADLVFLDLPQRLAKLLVALHAGEGPPGLAGMAQTEVAAHLGVTRQTLNRALSRLSGAGWVEVRREGLAVRDPAALREFAEG